jgi:peroxiredoxin
MVLTPSQMTRLGSAAPEFTLKDVVIGKTYTLSSFAQKKALLVMFICRHCPYVDHVKSELGRLEKDMRQKDIAIVGISSNDAENYPDDSPASLKEFSLTQGWHFPFLYDETQDAAKAYRAACTPDFFLYDKERKLVYRGQLDDSRPGNGKPLTGNDLRQSIGAVLDDKPVPSVQKPSIGCNIKWKKGQEPSYFS